MQEILKILPTKIDDIYQIAEGVGYSNIRVFKSPLAVDKDKINFLVSNDPKYPGIQTLENSGIFQWKLQKMFQSDHFTLVEEENLDKEFKEAILASAIPLSPDNMPKIKVVFSLQESALPLEKKPKLSIHGEGDTVNLTICFPKTKLATSAEANEMYYVELALKYLSELQAAQQEDHHQKKSNTFKRKLALV